MEFLEGWEGLVGQMVDAAWDGVTIKRCMLSERLRVAAATRVTRGYSYNATAAVLRGLCARLAEEPWRQPAKRVGRTVRAIVDECFRSASLRYDEAEDAAAAELVRFRLTPVERDVAVSSIRSRLRGKHYHPMARRRISRYC